MQLVVNGLPPREGQALSLIAQGLTAKQAARKMNCSHRNVEAHLNHSMARLGATNRVHLVAKAFADGILHLQKAQKLHSFILAALLLAGGPVLDVNLDDWGRYAARQTFRVRRGNTRFSLDLPA